MYINTIHYSRPAQVLLALYAVTFVAHVVSGFVLWSHVGHAPWTVLQALLLLAVPIQLYLISHLAVPELEDGRVHDLRQY